MKYQYDILQKHDEICKEYSFPDKKLNELKKKINNIKKEILKLETIIKVNNVNNRDINNNDINYSKIHKMKEEINELQNEYDNIKNGNSFTDYTLKTCQILDDYLILDECEKKLLRENNTNNFNEIVYKKRLLTDEYMVIVDPMYKKNQNFLQYIVKCKYCDKKLEDQSGFAVCENCGLSHTCIQAPTDLSYKEKLEIDTRQPFTYEKEYHLLDHLARFQAKENKEISQHILDKVILEAHKEKNYDLNKLDEKTVKRYLKKLQLNEYYDNVISIINRINKRPPFNLTTELEEKIKKMFKQIQEPFELYKGQRRNMISYNYILNKFFHILDLPEFSKYFTLLKSQDKLLLQDEIFKKIVDHMAKIDDSVKWRFFSSF